MPPPTARPFNPLAAVLDVLDEQLRQSIRAVAGSQGEHLGRGGGCQQRSTDVSAHPSDRYFSDAPDGSLLDGRVVLHWWPAAGWRKAGNRLWAFLDALELDGCDNARVEVVSQRDRDSGGRLLEGIVWLYCPLTWEPPT